MENDSQMDMFDDIPESIRAPEVSPLESKVEQRFVSNIRKLGGVSWKFVSINNRGVSDRIMLYHGRTIYVEMKRDKGKMTPLQESFRDKIISNGGEFVTIEGMKGVSQFCNRLASEKSIWKVANRALNQLVNNISGWYK